MKASTGKMLLDVARQAKGIIAIFERWVKSEAKIGTVSITSSGNSEVSESTQD